MIDEHAGPVEAEAPRGRVYIETYGCTFNASDAEVMAGLLERAGYHVIDSPAGADVVIINSCIVKERSYLDLRKRLAAFEEGVPAHQPVRRPAIVLAGCAPKVPQHGHEFARFAQLGPDNVACVVEVVEKALAGEVIHRVARSDAPRLALPKRRRNPAVEIVPISRGCLGRCSFCQTVLARGRLRSFAEDEIEAAVRDALRQGVREVWLTSQDCGAYGQDRATTLPGLLRRLARIPGDFRIRLGMVNPDWAKQFANELAEILAHPRFFRFAHLPVQAGSDAVLRAMRRDYTVDDFLAVCEVLRRAAPDISIATDVIAGFPTETDDDWAATIELLRRVRPAVVNRSRFSPRPGTAAARLAPLPSAVVARRSRELYYLTASLVAQRLRAWVGRTCPVIVEECPRPGIVLARDDTYTPVVIAGDYAPGTALTVRVEAVEGFHLRARPLAAGAVIPSGAAAL
jgi:threonylcarbamoyladenosine tRNA methylthiotransferase CDKAL1